MVVGRHSGPHHRYAGLPSAVMRKRTGRPKRAEGDMAVTTFLQLNNKAFPMLHYLGPHGSTDPILISKFIRLGKTYMLKVSFPHLLLVAEGNVKVLEPELEEAMEM